MTDKQFDHLTDDTDRLHIPRWAKVTSIAVGVLLTATLAFAVIQPVKVLPRIRLAPGYALVDQHGTSFTSETARSNVTLYNFAPLDCGSDCEDMFATLQQVRSRVASETDLADVDLKFVTIALDDSPTDGRLADAAAASGADGQEWRWIGGGWDEVRTVVGSGFNRYFERIDDGSVDFDPGFVLVDAEGIIRAEYRYRTLSNDSDKIVRQIGVLGDEIRYSHGAATAAYEAAHLFLCYD